MALDRMFLKAYGKINLALDVLRKREDGYHDVRMIMQTVGIYDGIELEKTDTGKIEITTNIFYLPTNENNIVYKAAKLLFDEFHIQSGIRISLNKFIPVSAGMAGGSTDAASVLFGINKMFDLNLSVKELMERGVSLEQTFRIALCVELRCQRELVKIKTASGYGEVSGSDCETANQCFDKICI